MKTKNKLIYLYKILTVSSKMGGAKFKYGVLKNLNNIEKDIEALKTIEKDIEEIVKEFFEKKNDVIVKYGTPGEDGNVVVTTDNNDYKLVTETITDLAEEYKDALNEYQKKRLEYETLLNEETEFDFKVHEISIDNVPDDFDELGILMEFNIIL